MKEDELNNLFNEALDNIRNDRKLAREFLNEIANEISSDAEHIETMQRSNEQLVKIISLRQKTSEESFALSEDDKSNLYDLIQGSESNV